MEMQAWLPELSEHVQAIVGASLGAGLCAFQAWRPADVSIVEAARAAIAVGFGENTRRRRAAGTGTGRRRARRRAQWSWTFLACVMVFGFMGFAMFLALSVYTSMALAFNPGGATAMDVFLRRLNDDGVGEDDDEEDDKAI